MHSTKIVIRPEAYWFMCVCLLLLPIKLVFAWMISVVIHEASHYLALRICRIPIPYIQIGLFGANMKTGPLTKGQELLSAAAGPLGGGLLLFFIRKLPLLSIIGILHSLFNLIPVYPMDGGRVLHSIVCLFTGKPHNKFCSVLDYTMIFLLLFFAIYGLVKLSLGLIPLILVFGLLWKKLKVKSSCKLDFD